MREPRRGEYFSRQSSHAMSLVHYWPDYQQLDHEHYSPRTSLSPVKHKIKSQIKVGYSITTGSKDPCPCHFLYISCRPLSHLLYTLFIPYLLLCTFPVCLWKSLLSHICSCLIWCLLLEAPSSPTSPFINPFFTPVYVYTTCLTLLAPDILFS